MHALHNGNQTQCPHTLYKAGPFHLFLRRKGKQGVRLKKTQMMVKIFLHIDHDEPLTCESSCETTWPLSCNGVSIGVLWSGCCWGATVHFWELEHQFRRWSGAPTRPLFQYPDLCEGNLLWRWGLGVWRRRLCLIPTWRAARTGAGAARWSCIQDDSTSWGWTGDTLTEFKVVWFRFKLLIEAYNVIQAILRRDINLHVAWWLNHIHFKR